LSLAHIVKDIVHPTIDVYGLMVIVSHHVVDPGFCRLLEEKAFLGSFLIFPRVLHHEPLIRHIFNKGFPAPSCPARDRTLPLTLCKLSTSIHLDLTRDG
jgi:hypothetical protein